VLAYIIGGVVAASVAGFAGGFRYHSTLCENARLKAEAVARAKAEAVDEANKTAVALIIKERETLRTRIEEDKTKLAMALGKADLPKSCRIDDQLRDAINAQLSGGDSSRTTTPVRTERRAPK
jgi:hypothetical protein